VFGLNRLLQCIERYAAAAFFIVRGFEIWYDENTKIALR